MENTNFRIIIIDDNPAIHQDFIKILKTDVSSEFDNLSMEIFGKKNEKEHLPNFEIDAVYQGEEGVKRIREALQQGNPYSLAFVDIRMPPGWDGIETIKHIWELDKDIQVVICTAYSDYSWEETITHLGKTDNLLILKKPFDSVSVRQLACALTTKWQLAEESRKYTSMLKQEVADQTLSLQYQATHDFLTGLPNRVKLFERMRLAIKTSSLNKSEFAVLFLDLDRFKLVNDSLSHEVGDELLRTASNRLKTGIRSEDTLARLGGDEFVIIFMNIDNKEKLEAKVHSLLNTFQQPFDVADRKVTITASIGISLYPKDGKTVDILLRNADAAMYAAKAHKGNNFQFYTSEMSMQSLAVLDQEMELREAIVNGEFFLCYQPQIDLTEEKLVAVEALIRWQHPKKGILLPIDFIPLAEETGLIVSIGEWVMRSACAQNKAWQDAGFSPIRMAVNVTAEQIIQHDLIKTVSNILNETGLKPEYLELELTENVILSNREIIRAVTELKKLGVIIAIDDFGTGYSSLSYLHKIPLDRLKIDSSFIQHIKSATDDEVIIRAVIAMAKNLNLEVLAEGVETIDQLNFLKKYNCDDVQGFYFSKPLTKKELEGYLKNPTKMKKIITLTSESK